MNNYQIVRSRLIFLVVGVVVAFSIPNKSKYLSRYNQETK